MVEGTCLENRRAGNGTEGSNPSLSARRGALRLLSGRFSSCEAKRIRSSGSVKRSGKARSALSLPLRQEKAREDR